MHSGPVESAKQTLIDLPLHAGLQVGQAVAMLTFGGFSEFAVEEARMCVPIPEANPEAVAFLTSGLTASCALESARMRSGQTVLVTAAAGGTGMFAVQLAKQAGCHVVGTCGSAEKGKLLARLGVDRVVNYRQESLKEARATLPCAERRSC
jgi:NADPH:quinone reductase-like Zn-dependent oxidoreductase